MKNSLSISSLCEEAQGYSLMLDYLSKALRLRPSEEILAPQRNPDLFREAPCADTEPDMKKGLETMSKWATSKENAQQLARDFDILFEGPEKPICPPWESAFLSEGDVLFQRQALEAKELYRDQGLEIDSDINEPADHIAFELSFCSILLNRAYKAAESHDEQKCRDYLELASSFCRKHVNNWMPEWAQNLENKASTSYYRGISLLLKGSLSGLGSLMSSTNELLKCD